MTKNIDLFYDIIFFLDVHVIHKLSHITVSVLEELTDALPKKLHKIQHTDPFFILCSVQIF